MAARWTRIESQDLRVDLARVLEKLPAELAKIAHILFDGESVGDAARKLGISRAAAYRHLNQLRRHLDAAGLRAYISGPRRASETPLEV
jgi:DNA-directed RNA polymerase specialized sigma24 family protein